MSLNQLSITKRNENKCITPNKLTTDRTEEDSGRVDPTGCWKGIRFQLRETGTKELNWSEGMGGVVGGLVKRLGGESEEEGMRSVSLHGCVLGGRVLRLVDQRLSGFRDAVVLGTWNTGGPWRGDLSLNQEEE